MKYLGIDYGSKRVGLATSDDDGVFAFPYKILKNENTLVDTIHNICGEENIQGIVVGESTDLSGEPNKIMGSIEKLVKTLEADLGLPIYLQKEFMTTIEARGRAGKEVNNARKVAKAELAAADASAAALILQRYLDKKNVNK
jgi:putative Holliday junction resolvase